MKSDLITVSNKENSLNEALAQAEKVSAYKGLTGKNALHLRLLTEEMMGLMRSITGETEGTFWIEDSNNEYCLHLQVMTPMDSKKREQLLSVSASGKNESAKGLMGKLRDFFDRGADADIAPFSSSLMLPDMYERASMRAADWEWSMIRYEEALANRVKNDDASAKEAWDELEKSVVAKVADDVKISIRGRMVEMIIIKRLQ